MALIDAEELKAMLMASTQSMRDYQKSSCTALAHHAGGWIAAIDVALAQIDDLVDKTKSPSSGSTD